MSDRQHVNLFRYTHPLIIERANVSEIGDDINMCTYCETHYKRNLLPYNPYLHKSDNKSTDKPKESV